MPTFRVNSLVGRPLLDLRSLARRGPGRQDRFSPDELAFIGRTIGGVPEVMVKVLSKDSNNLRSVAGHLNYIGRSGELELETDDSGRLQERGVGRRLVEDWDLDLDQNRWGSELSTRTGRAPKLVHKIMLSMPPGTPAKGVLEAARNFAREEFALKHRYALALHTDEPHPHVHLVVKAVSEQGVRLNIRKATLRGWRWEFARHLRGQGISANATERAVRGQTRTHKKDGIYRAARRGDSTHSRARIESVAAELMSGGHHAEPGKSKLIETRRKTECGWYAISNILRAQGHADLAVQLRRFVAQMHPARTEREVIASELQKRLRAHEIPDPSRAS